MEVGKADRTEARERATKQAKETEKAELQRQTRMAAERAAKEAAQGPQGGAETSKAGATRGKFMSGLWGGDMVESTGVLLKTKSSRLGDELR